MEEGLFHALCHREVERADGRERWLETGEIVAVYTDGGVMGANPSLVGGTWAWCGVNREDVRVVEKSGLLRFGDGDLKGIPYVSNNQTEFFAMAKAIAAMPDGWDGKLVTDTYVNISRYEKSRKRMRVGDIRSTAAPPNTPVRWWTYFCRHVARMGDVQLVQVLGHTEALVGTDEYVEHNCWCDGECNRLKGEWYTLSARERRELRSDARRTLVAQAQASV